MPTYALGLDFGTESARIVALDTDSGDEALVHEATYQHGVLDTALPNGRPLPPEWALQHPGDYHFEGAPAVFAAAARFLEAGDWMVWQLTGQERRSACQAGFKAHERFGYPPAADLERLATGFSALNERLAPPVAVGTRAGVLTATWAQRTGLRVGTPVGVAVIDAHAAVPGLGVTGGCSGCRHGNVHVSSAACGGSASRAWYCRRCA